MSNQEPRPPLQFPEMPRPAPTVTLWAGRPAPNEADLHARLTSDGYQALPWASLPDQGSLPHAHIYTELLWLVTGSLTVVLPADGRLIELGPGDRIEIPAGIVHASRAGPEGARYLVATK